MDEPAKRAYRNLLHQGMLDIRELCHTHRRPPWNPLAWRKQYRRCRMAWALADWLHKLAAFSRDDFAGFDPDYFWSEYEAIRALRAGGGHRQYRRIYEDCLADAAAGVEAPPAPPAHSAPQAPSPVPHPAPHRLKA